MSDELNRRITEYLAMGGLFNPEMALHDRVRDLIIDCRAKLDAVTRERDEYDKARQEIAALCVRTLLAIKEYGLDT